MKKIKRLVCIIMAALVLVTAPVTTYMEASAVEVIIPTTMEIWEAILAMFGVSVGLGNQSDYFSQSSFDEFSTAVSNGHVYHMDNYGDVDFSDDDSVAGWLKWANGIDRYLLATGDAPIAVYSNVIKTGAMSIDYASYKMTGTSATNAMHEYINEFIGDYNAGTEALAEDIRNTFTVITGGAGNNDDDEDPEKNSSRFKRVMAVISAAMLGGCSALAPLAALKVSENSTFNEYDAAFEEGGFVPGQSFPVYHNPSVSSFNAGNYLIVGSYVSSDYGHGTLIYPFEQDKSFLFGIKDSDTVNVYRVAVLNGKIGSSYFNVKSDCIYKSYPGWDESGYNWFSSSHFDYSKGSFLFPVFSSLEAFENYKLTGDVSSILNLKDASAYANFKNNAASAAARLGSYLRSWLTAPGYLKNLPDIIKPVLDAADSSAGATDSIDVAEDELSKIIPSPSPDPTPEPSPSEGKNYFGILGQILTVLKNIYFATNNLPSRMAASFASKFMTADALEHILTGDMPVLFAEAFAEALVLPIQPVVDSINLLPESMKARLIEVFPDSVAVGNAIIGFPDAVGDAVADAVKGIDIKIPDIKIPAIEIPEIEIPEIVIPEIVIPEIAVPDVNVELNPAYNITVANDFTGLGGIISSAVEAVLVKCFVPDEAATMEKFSEMEEFFRFKDDIIAAIGDLKTMLFGITPSPILKIPIGKPTSKKYNYGTGSYIIIDVSWYAQYKQLGDKIVLAIAWALFLWRMFIKLPGIISGTEGTIVAADKAHNRYEYVKSSRKE